MKKISQNASVAYLNGISKIDLNLVFPDNVFFDHSNNFLFFESSWIFSSRFMGFLSLLLAAEEADVACLINLNRRNTDEDDFLILEKTLTGDAFFKNLSTPLDWAYTFDRYVCSSEKGDWSIYSEKDSDIAVFSCPQEKASLFSTATEFVGAEPIRDLISYKTPCYPFDSLIPKWRDGLLKNYEKNLVPR